MSKNDYIIKKKRNPLFTLIKIITSIVVLVIMIGLENAVEINNLCFANIIGLDKSPNNNENLLATFQFITPKLESSNSVSNNKTIVTSIDEKSINLAISSLQNYMNSSISFSNANAIIISEDLAKDGVQRYISALSNNLKFNTNMYVLICEGSAKEFIETLDKNKDISPTKEFDILKNSEKKTGAVDVINLTKFEDYLYTPNASPYAPLCRVNTTDDKSSKDDDSNKESDAKSEDSNDKSTEEKKDDTDTSDTVDNTTSTNDNVIKQKSNIKVEIGGTAIFDGEKLIGKLTSEETALHLMLTSVLDSYDTTLTTKDNSTTTNQNSSTDVNIHQTGKAKIKVTTNGYRPRADIEIPLNVLVLSNPVGEYNYTNLEYMNNLKKQITDILNEKMDNYLNKIQNEYNSDIDNLYKYSKTKFLTYEEYINYDFKEKFKYMKINVKFNILFKDSGLNLEK